MGWDVKIPDATNGTWNNLPIHECLKIDTDQCIGVSIFHVLGAYGIYLGIQVPIFKIVPPTFTCSRIFE